MKNLGCVPKAVHEAEKGRLARFEKLSVDQKFELEKLKVLSFFELDFARNL